MTVNTDATLEYIHAAGARAHDHRARSTASKTGRFLLHLLEMTLAMGVGMAVFHMLEDQVPASSIFAPFFADGANLYDLTMGVMMTVPMVAWMIVRGHGWRHGAEMAFAMFAPLAVIIVLRLLGAGDNLTWLADAGHVATFPGMVMAMVYRRDHYVHKARQLAHAAHR